VAREKRQLPVPRLRAIKSRLRELITGIFATDDSNPVLFA